MLNFFQTCAKNLFYEHHQFYFAGNVVATTPEPKLSTI